jgi:SAM-dependent methyltransferase
MANEYSRQWFEIFLDTIPADQTRHEVAFLRRNLPLPQFHRVLDVCCGSGRHARLLAEAGYEVVGIDRDTALFADGESIPDGLEFVTGDMRDLEGLPAHFDAVVNMWASFGYFDESTHRAVLAGMARRLRSGGRLILDIYHAGFFLGKDGCRSHERGGTRVIGMKRCRDGRMVVELTYPDATTDTMDWQVFTPEDLIATCAAVGLRPLVRCCRFDEGTPPSSAEPRMQLVFERP